MYTISKWMARIVILSYGSTHCHVSCCTELQSNLWITDTTFERCHLMYSKFWLREIDQTNLPQHRLMQYRISTNAITSNWFRFETQFQCFNLSIEPHQCVTFLSAAEVISMSQLSCAPPLLEKKSIFRDHSFCFLQKFFSHVD